MATNLSHALSRASSWLVGLTLLLSTTSCFDILERLQVNKDGSGEYLLEIDMSEMIGMIKAFSGGSEGEDGEAWNPEEPTRMDTLIRFADMPDSLSRTWKYPQVTARGLIGMSMDMEASQMMLRIRLPFNRVEEINQFGHDMGSGLAALDDPIGASSPGELSSILPGMESDQFSFKPKQLSRKPIDWSQAQAELSQEERDMANMVLGNANYTVEYILPGKVKKVEGLGYAISEDGKTVRGQFRLGDLMQGKADLGLNIPYK
jgi:hypothetical protein